VDIEGWTLNRFDPETGDNRPMPVGEAIGCVGLRAGGGFVAGLRSGLWLLDGEGRKERFIADPQPDNTISRFNDGRVDPWGRFWAGTMHEPRDRPAAALWRVNEDLSVDRLAGEVTVSNGLAFSPDRRWAYHSDTPAHVVYRYPLDGAGNPGERTVFHRFPAGGGRPDGAAVDEEGCYWSALFDGGRVVRLSPDGELLESRAVPARCPTMCAFAGNDLRTLYVTSARHGRPEEELVAFPESGNIFALPTEVAGLPAPEFAG